MTVTNELFVTSNKFLINLKLIHYCTLSLVFNFFTKAKPEDFIYKWTFYHNEIFPLVSILLVPFRKVNLTYLKHDSFVLNIPSN